MKKGLSYIILALVLATCIMQEAAAQKAMAGVDRNKIVIGEQVNLVLAVENAASLSAWFDLPDSINHIEVVERQKIDTIRIGNIVNYKQAITITSFDSGRWELPALKLPGTTAATPPITIDVLPVDVSHMQDYHDVKEIEEVQVKTPWYIIAAIVLVTLLSIIFIYWLYKKKKQQVIIKPVLKQNQTPLQWALAELDKLQQQQLYLHKEVKQHYSRITDIARSFFHLQLQHPALYETTDEWMVRLQYVPVDSQAKLSFFQLLRLAETVKFAKYIPPVEENERAVDTAKQIINHVADAEANTAFQPRIS